MLEHEFGFLFNDRDGKLYLATFDENDGGWIVSRENLEHISTEYAEPSYYIGRDHV